MFTRQAGSEGQYLKLHEIASLLVKYSLSIGPHIVSSGHAGSLLKII